MAFWGKQTSDTIIIAVKDKKKILKYRAELGFLIWLEIGDMESQPITEEEIPKYQAQGYELVDLTKKEGDE